MISRTTPVSYKVAVVIPSYKVTKHIEGVLKSIPEIVDVVYVVDDKCPENSGEFVEKLNLGDRIRVLHHQENLGVGGATLTGMKTAFEEGADIAVKVDGDGQMRPELIPGLIQPIVSGYADYSKGNRFFDLDSLRQMPAIRIFGNMGLSFLTKLSSGYWSVMDPTNGFVALHRTAFSLLPTQKIAKRYFFESDLLFRLGTVRAKVVDVPMESVYGDEVSGLQIHKITHEFAWKHLKCILKRISYTYFLRDFAISSLSLVLGVLFSVCGAVFGLLVWIDNASRSTVTPTGTIMLSALPVLIGVLLLLLFSAYDMSNEPKIPIQKQY